MFTAAHRRAGNEVEVATFDDPREPFSKLAGATVHAFGPTKGTYRYQPKLKHWLKTNVNRFDGIIVNGVWQYHGVAVREAVAGRRPYVVFSHGMLDPYFMRRFPLKHMKKLVYWTLFERRNLDQAKAVCFTSHEELNCAAEGFPFRYKFKRVVVPYGTMGPSGDPAALKEAFFKACPAVRSQPYLLFLGRLHPKKGCDLLLEAYAKILPNLELVMVGPDDAGWQAELMALAERLGIQKRVHWTGPLRGDAKWGAFYGAEAFILPSHQENFGIAVADALACGTIPLISDKVNIARDVESDGAAFVETDSVDGTTRLLERFIASSPLEKETMRKNARKSFETRYALKNAAQEVYKALGIAP